MVIESDSRKFITARKYPLMVKIQPSIEKSTLKLSAPGMRDIHVDLNDVLNGLKDRAEVWDAPVDVYDCGDEIAKWFSRFLLKNDDGLRLVYYPYSNPTRPIRSKNLIFKTLSQEHVGALHDATSYMLLNQGSLDELNKRLTTPASALHFRPNIVIKGPLPYAEDSFKYVRIGRGTIFKAVKPCTRCIFTTIDPETGVKDSLKEPLATLKK